MFYLTERKEKLKVEDTNTAPDDAKERKEKNKLGASASGIDLTEQIIMRKVLL